MKKIVLSFLVLIFITFISCKKEKKDPKITVEKIEEEVKPSISSLEKKGIEIKLESKSGSKAKGKIYITET
ncbi:MAG: hypothetical protein ACI93N_000923, partial [Flavobacteriaceae bacterium]